jgi:hypothetical protein
LCRKVVAVQPGLFHGFPLELACRSHSFDCLLNMLRSCAATDVSGVPSIPCTPTSFHRSPLPRLFPRSVPIIASSHLYSPSLPTCLPLPLQLSRRREGRYSSVLSTWAPAEPPVRRRFCPRKVTVVDSWQGAEGLCGLSDDAELAAAAQPSEGSSLIPHNPVRRPPPPLLPSPSPRSPSRRD